jgi:cobalt-zinc-cadmium efflux system protein
MLGHGGQRPARGPPEGLDLEDVRCHILETEGVVGCNVWTITSGMNVISVHVVLEHRTEGPDVLRRLREYLAHHFDLEHSTFQLEPGTYRARERAMHD